MRGKSRGRVGAFSRTRGVGNRNMASASTARTSQSMARTDSNMSFSTTDSRNKRGRTSSSQELDEGDGYSQEERPPKLRRLSGNAVVNDGSLPSEFHSQPSDVDKEDVETRPRDSALSEDDEEEDEVMNEDAADGEGFDRHVNGEILEEDDLGAENASSTSLVLEGTARRGGYANRRGKRRKGWNLRKANKIASGVPLQTTPLRLEDGNDEKPRAGGILDRLPGRRRVPHADPIVEADMRRQLELKVAYRAVVKVLKPVLAELARRTNENLEKDAGAHMQPDEYGEITNELHRRLDSRLAIVDCWFAEETARLEREFAARQHTIAENYQSAWEDRHDSYILKAQGKFMTVLRQLERSSDDEATDDEGDLTGAQFTVDHDSGKRVPLMEAALSRSLSLMSIGREFQNLCIRTRFRDAARLYQPEDFETEPSFAFYDGAKRRAANARWNVLQLVDAGAYVEDYARRKAQIVTNEQATGLQELLQAIEIAPALIKSPAPASPVSLTRPKTEELVYARDELAPGSLSSPKHNAVLKDSSRETSQASTSAYPPHPNPGPARRGPAIPSSDVPQYMDSHERLEYFSGPAEQLRVIRDRVDSQAVNGFDLVREQQQRGGYLAAHARVSNSLGTTSRPHHLPAPAPAPVAPPPSQGPSASHTYNPPAEPGHMIVAGQNQFGPAPTSPPGSRVEKKPRKQPVHKADYSHAANVPPGMQPPPPGYEYQPRLGYSAPPIVAPRIQSSAPLPNDGRPPAEHQASNIPLSYAQGPGRDSASRPSPKSSLPPLAPAHSLQNRDVNYPGRLVAPARSSFPSSSESSCEHNSPRFRDRAASDIAGVAGYRSPNLQSGSVSGTRYGYTPYSPPSQARQVQAPNTHHFAARMPSHAPREAKEHSQASSPYSASISPTSLLPLPSASHGSSAGTGYPPHPHQHQPSSTHVHSQLGHSGGGYKAQSIHPPTALGRDTGPTRYQPLPTPLSAPARGGQPSASLLPALNAGPLSRLGTLPLPQTAHPGQRLGGHPPLLPALSEGPRYLSQIGGGSNAHGRQASATSGSPMSPPPRPLPYGRAEDTTSAQLHSRYSPHAQQPPLARISVPSSTHSAQGPPPPTQSPTTWPGFSGPSNYPWPSSGGGASTPSASYPQHTPASLAGTLRDENPNGHTDASRTRQNSRSR